MDRPLNLQQAITNLQTYLRAISFVDGRIRRVPIDGLFDTDTQGAVFEFQSTRGLPSTGVVDKATWDAIYAEYLEILKASDRQPTVNFFPTEPEGYEAAFGEESTFIAIVQLMLRELSAIYDDIDINDINGVFDRETEEAIKIFQLASRLPVTGRINRVTWNRLGKDFTNYTHDLTI